MSIRQAWFISLTLSLLGSQLWATTPSSEEIPFRLYRGHWVMFEGSLFDRADKVRIVLDTGAAASFVNARTARKLGLPLLAGSSRASSFGKSRRVRQTVLRGLRLGPRMVTIAGYVAELPWKEIDVILGMDVLQQSSFLIDYERRMLQFGVQTTLESAVPFEMVNSSLVVSIRVGAEDVRLAVDTGAAQSTLFQDAVKTWIKRLRGGRRLVMMHAAGSSMATEVRLPSVQLGSVTWKNVPVLLLDAKRNGRKDSGVLSPIGMGMRRASLNFEDNLFSWELQDRL